MVNQIYNQSFWSWQLFIFNPRLQNYSMVLTSLNIIVFMLNKIFLSILLAIYFDSQNCFEWAQTENLIYEAINDQKFSGCVLGIATHNSTIYKKAFGTIYHKQGFYAPPVTTSMKFDINYLTQVIAMNSILMNLIDIRKLHTSHRVGQYINTYDEIGKRDIKISQLLLHNSGNHDKMLGLLFQYNKTYPKTAEELLKAINSQKLAYSVGTKSIYSELGYIILGQISQKITNKVTRDLLADILQYLDMFSTSFSPKDKDEVVPGGYNEGVTRGTPFNKAAKFLQNQAGHSGLFSTVGDLINYMQMMLNKGKVSGKVLRLFSEEVINEFLTVPTLKSYKNTKALGWESVPLTNPPCGKKFSSNSFGLSDLTGSYVWADASKNITIVFLANGHFPTKNFEVESWQGRLSDAIMTGLGY